MKNVIAFLFLWLGLIIQSTLFQVPPIRLIQPNFVLVLLVLTAVTRGARVALVLGVVVGFIQDVDYGSFLGLNAFVYGLIGYFAAAVVAQFMQRNVPLTMLVTVVCTFVQNWLSYGLTRLFDITAYSAHAVLSFALEQMVINGVLLLFLYPLAMRTLVDRGQKRYRESDSDMI
ncbi:hypothetical protein GCM10025857_37160 [Alicyclobacillus contaminans]|uniref:rod shape-determining protein MreD n=1 Tax=Alicyclobacillus contaminans TaxID=392016 RepID=UPI000478CB3D|nr:rod shape-determining protein MreD [Alicyclobacillus contaminans]GMA52359.1 hypothetical protein GCM10025857_37160 [Alicyclobacillus contaminans]